MPDIVTPWKPWTNFKMGTVTWSTGSKLESLCIDLNQTTGEQILIPNFIKKKLLEAKNYEAN